MALATKENVFAAADALKAQGAIVTQNAIREAIGGGSFTTISAFLQEWRKDHPREAQAAREAAEQTRQALIDRLDPERRKKQDFASASENARGLGPLDSERTAPPEQALDLAKQQLAPAQAQAIDALREELRAHQTEIARLACALGAAQEREAMAKKRAVFYAKELSRHIKSHAKEWKADKKPKRKSGQNKDSA